MTPIREAQELYLEEAPFTRPYFRVVNHRVYIGCGRISDHMRNEMEDVENERKNQEHQIAMLDLQRQLPAKGYIEINLKAIDKNMDPSEILERYMQTGFPVFIDRGRDDMPRFHKFKTI